MTAFAAEAPTADLRLVSFTVPEQEVVRGLPVDLDLTVENPGERAAHRVSLSLFEDRAKVASKTFYTTIEAHTDKDFHWSWIPKRGGKLRLTAVLGSNGELPDAKSASAISKSQLITVEDAQGQNLEISKLDVTPAKVDREVTADVLVHNAGKLGAKDVRIVMFADSVRLASSQSAPIPAGGESHFQLRWVPRNKGSVRVHFQVQGSGEAGRKVEKQSVIEVQP